MVVVHSKILQHPHCQPANHERVFRLFHRILLFESTLYVLIKSRLRDRLDHLQNFFAPFLNLFAATKQYVDLEYLFRLPLPTFALKIKVKTFKKFFCVFNYSFFLIKICRMASDISRKRLICSFWVWNKMCVSRYSLFFPKNDPLSQFRERFFG